VADSSELLIDAAAEPFARFLFAHGAGAPMDSSFMTAVAADLAARGVEVVRFEFPYRAGRRTSGKRRPPDKTAVLLDTWNQLIERYSDDALPLFIGGKSMGGRMATMWAADHTAEHCRGIVCLGYPFHPQGKPEQLRTEHLNSIQVPVLMVQGERDALGSRSEVEAMGLGAPINLFWLAAADHDLKPLRSSGHTHQQHLNSAADAVVRFMRNCLCAS